MTIVRLPRTARRNQIVQVMNNLAIAGLGDIPALDLNFVGSANPLPASVTFTRASGGTRVNPSGLIELLSTDQPRFDYNPITLAQRGLLIEEQRTNLLSQSNLLSDAVWTKTNTTISATGIGPDGATANKVVASAGVAIHGVNTLSSVTSGLAAKTGTIYLKAGEYGFAKVYMSDNVSGDFRADITLATGAVGSVMTTGVWTSTSITSSDAGNGWWRVSLTGTNATNATAFIKVNIENSLGNESFNGDGTSGIYAGCAQIEVGAFPTSYIPTTAAAVTRAADVASMTGANFSSWFNTTEGTFVAVCDTEHPASGYTASSGVVASGASARFIYQPNASQAHKSYDGTTILHGITNVMTGVHKTASGYTAGTSRSLCSDGGAVQTTATCAAPYTAGSALYIGQMNDGNYMDGHIQRLTYYNKRLPDATLQALST